MHPRETLDKDPGPGNRPESRDGSPEAPARQPWRVGVWALLGMLAAIVLVGLVGVFVNRDIKSAADDALRYDVELEDHGDDLRVAVLEVRQQQRTLYFGDEVTRTGLSNLESAYDLLTEEIDEYSSLEIREEQEGEMVSPEEFRALAETYYREYRTAIDEFENGGDRAAWDSANDLALARLDEMQLAAAEIDEVGEELSENSLARVDREATAGMVLLIAVITGLLLVGAVLAYSTVRVFSELRRLYRSQREATEELAAASKAKTDFLADVSHELRTPLTVLRGNAEIGLRMQQDEMQQEILAEILAESDKMTKMVEDLLFLARSDSSSLPLDSSRVEVEDFLRSVAARAGVLARERGATFEFDLRATGEAELDPARIEQAILVFVDNAAKYAGGHGPILLKSRNEGDRLVVSVSDRGPGIPKEDLELIFERFYRLDKTRSRKLGGAGLGLPIAKTIVEGHGGTVRAESVPGEGTTMSLTLPLGPNEHPDDGSGDSARSGGTDHAREKSPST